MKTTKISLLSLLLSIVLATLTGCYYSHVSSEICFKNGDGAGYKTIYMELLKDGAKDPHGETVSGNEDFLPQGPQAVADWLAQNVPSGFDAGVIEKEDRYLFYISYEFNDIDDYNAKTKQLIGQQRWNAKGLQDATLKITDEEGFYHLTFKEDAKNSIESALAYFEQIYNNPSLFDPHGYTLEETYHLFKADVNIGYKTTTFDLDPNAEFEATGLVRNSWTDCGEYLKHAVQEPFVIKVVDSETGRGIPLVELKTINDRVYYTDSAGIVAFNEPGLMNQDVFFFISSHGYLYPQGPFGYRGTTVTVTPGGSVTLQMDRVNIAERLYRVTGQGIYRDSLLAGIKPPIEEPALNAKVVGQDGGLVTLYKGRLFWLWGDTNSPTLTGNYRGTVAFSDLPENGGLDPDVGINYEYVKDQNGFVKQVVPPLPDGGALAWVSGLMTIEDSQGQERLVAGYSSVNGLSPPVGKGILLWDDVQQEFVHLVSFPDPDDWRFPSWKAVYYEDNGQGYYLFSHPFFFLRVKANLSDITDYTKYETFTPLKPGTTFDEQNPQNTQLDRDANGNLIWDWKLNTGPLTQLQEKQLIDLGLITSSDPKYYQFKDIDTNEEVIMHSGGSVSWNEYRQKWIMIGIQSFGSTSLVGEVWYAESDNPEGPWTYAKKIITHNDYSFYNPVQIEFLNKNGGKDIYLNASYSNAFSGSTATPGDNYNLIMYKLDLSDPRLDLTP